MKFVEDPEQVACDLISELRELYPRVEAARQRKKKVGAHYFWVGCVLLPGAWFIHWAWMGFAVGLWLCAVGQWKTYGVSETQLATTMLRLRSLQTKLPSSLRVRVLVEWRRFRVAIRPVSICEGLSIDKRVQR